MNYFTFTILLMFISLFDANLSVAETLDFKKKAEEWQIDKEIIDNSTVFQEWLKKVPSILQKINNQPSFTTRLKFGYAQFPSNHHGGGIKIGIEDLFLGKTPLTVNADYTGSFRDDRLSIGADLHYYLLPLGGYINLAPVIGYRYLQTEGYITDGVNVGLRLGLIFSPYGGGDMFITQSFVSPTGANEVGITEINAGYALTKNMRISTAIEWQNSRQKGDSQISLGLQWIIDSAN